MYLDMAHDLSTRVAVGGPLSGMSIHHHLQTCAEGASIAIYMIDDC